MTTLTNPLDGKGPKDLFRFGKANDIIDTVDAADGGSSIDGGYNIDGGAGNDSITGSSAGDTLVGGTGSDIIAGGGGSDTIHGGKASGNEGKDRASITNTLYGEAESVTISADGGADGDTIFGGDGAHNSIYGDYLTLAVTAGFTYTGGGDTIFGGDLAHRIAAVNDVYGDAHTLHLGANATFNGGNDNITGGANADNSLYGDTFRLFFDGDATFNGGNDVLTGGDGGQSVNDLYGDAQTVDFQGNAGIAQGGDDRLVSGTDTNDVMHGDFVQILGDGATGTVINGTVIGGADTFVFGVENGSDRITDFEQGKDKVELSGFDNINSFGDLAGRWIDSFLFDDTVVLDLDGTTDGFGDIIVFQGIADATGFSADDFAFV
jgi:Ca2+-binding RTX toxin-like protein